MPTGGHNRGRGRSAKWIFDHVNYDGDGCLIWPFSRSDTGYGQLGYMGKIHKAHRFMCEQANGPPPSPIHEAAHNCGNGMGGCVHPKHLDWKTPSENHLDRARHGTAATNLYGNTGKLTKQQRQEIIDLKGKMTQREIAKLYGVRFQTISRWHNADLNKELKSAPFDAQEDAKLIDAASRGLSNPAIADMLGRKISSITSRKHRLRRQGRLPQITSRQST